MGWNLSGLSAITRVPRNTYFDGESNPVEISSNDRFALNGQRLITKTGTYGADRSTYGTETEDFSTITSLSSVGGGPQYFEVLTKDGVLMEFGKTTDSQFSSEIATTILFWRLNKVRYPDGNYITYEYSDPSISGIRDSRLLKIKYTGNDIPGATLAPYNVIEFSYKIRQETTVNGTFSDVRTVYEAGSSIVSKYLLDLVTVKAEDSVVKKYQLEYGHDNINSYLKSVTESGSDGSQLNPTIFKYGDAPQSFTQSTNTALPAGAIDYFSGDFDGNGKSDIVLAEYTGGGYFLPDVFPKKYTNFRIARDGNPANLSPTILLNDGAQVLKFMKDYFTQTGDFNGDGLNDMVIAEVDQVIAEGKPTMRLKSVNIYTSNLTPGDQASDNLGFVTNITSPYYQYIPQKGNYLFAGDFDGDGLKDLITITKSTPAHHSNIIHESLFHRSYIDTSNNYVHDRFPIVSDTDSLSLANKWAMADMIYILDFNGDGKDDVMTVGEFESRIYTSVTNAPNGRYSFKLIYSSFSFIKRGDNNVLLGDFNADGKTDILYRHALVASGDPDTAPWTMAISTGKEFISKNFTFSTQASPLNDIISVSDFNGDGKSDIFRQFYGSVSTNNVEIYYSTGDSFYKSEQFSHSSLRDADKTWTVSDLSGDGRSEILFRNSQGTCTVISPKKDGTEAILQKAQNGLGYTTEWTYKPLSAGGSFYTKGSVSSTDYPFNKIQIPLFTVSEYQLPDGMGGTSTIQYSYEGARIHRAGKGFLGFTRVTTSNLTMGVKTVSENEFNTTYYVAVPKKTSSFLMDTNNTPISSTTLTNTFVSPASKRYWIKTTNINTIQTLEGREVSTINIYDDLNGNITKSTVNNSIETTITDTEYGSYLTSFLNRPTLITVNKSRVGNTGSFSVKTKMVYNTVNAQLETKTDFFDTAKEIIKSYLYHPRGSLKKLQLQLMKKTLHYLPVPLPLKYTTISSGFRKQLKMNWNRYLLSSMMQMGRDGVSRKL
jgi:hypothetical protein